MATAFVSWSDGSSTEEDFSSVDEAARWSYRTPGVKVSAVCDKLELGLLSDEEDRQVLICVECIRPHSNTQSWYEPEEELDSPTSGKKKRKVSRCRPCPTK